MLPALLAALLWSCSSIIVNNGLKHLRDVADPVVSIVFALFVCLVFGFSVAWLWGGMPDPLAGINGYVIAAGLFTFPIGTGAYYLTAISYGDRSEVASQYANVKPLLSIAAGVLLFGEVLRSGDLVVCALIVLAIFTMLSGRITVRSQLVPILLGLALATSWSLGEIAVRATTGGAASQQVSIGALFSSMLITGAVLAGILITRKIRSRDIRLAPLKYWQFAAHGILSFGLAYSLFFASIRTNGLSSTIMVTVFWPTLALVLNVGIQTIRGQSYSLDRRTLVSLGLLTFASVLHVGLNLL